MAMVIGVLVISSPAASAATGTPGYGVEFFTPVGPGTAWAVTTANAATNPAEAVERTTDGGSHWSDVTPPGLSIATGASAILGADFLSSERAWVTSGSYSARHVNLLTTSDGGRSWQRVGAAPATCSLDFVDAEDGWCIGLDGAAGSEGVVIDRTTDGGAAWREVSHTGDRPAASSPGSLPFACDKSIVFASRTLGYAASSCDGSGGYLETTTDGGARWHPSLKPPAVATDGGGAVFTPVVGRSDQGATGYTVDTKRPVTEIYRTTTAGRRWTRIRLPVARSALDVDIVSPVIWKVVSFARVLTTSDAGRTWTSFRPVGLRPSGVGLPDVSFATSRDGWDLLAESNDGAVLHTIDGGRSWQSERVPL